MRIASVGNFADSLGMAYGLTGSHREWAATPQEELDRTIQERLPSMMASSGPATRVDGVADGFFGESAALDAPDPFGMPPQPGPMMAPRYGGEDDIVPMGVPKNNNLPIILAVAVGGAVLLIFAVVLIIVI